MLRCVSNDPDPVLKFLVRRKLGGKELLWAIEEYYQAQGVRFERVEFPFRGPKNIGIITEPPA